MDIIQDAIWKELAQPAGIAEINGGEAEPGAMKLWSFAPPAAKVRITAAIAENAERVTVRDALVEVFNEKARIASAGCSTRLLFKLAARLDFIPAGTDASLSLEDVSQRHQQLAAGVLRNGWLEPPYYCSELHACSMVCGTMDQRFPLDAVVERRMHATKLAALLDPDACFDALRYAFHAHPRNACRFTAELLYRIVEE